LLDNIEFVVDEGLCVGCGTCAGVCPVDALEMRVLNGLFLPVVDWDKCTRCGLCVRCCPGYAVDFEDLNHLVFGKQPEDKLTGNFLSCHVGHSNDEEIRFNSASGGVVTQLLIYALEKGLIDGAIVTRMRQDKPLLPESFIAKTRDDIISASKSKYCPTSPGEVLKQVLKEEGRFAFVGLPCQIHGVRKAEMNIKGLKEKIVLHIGLFCSHTVNFEGTRFLLRKLSVSPELVTEIAYRGRGWPGYMFIKLKSGLSLTLAYVGGWNAYWTIFSSFFYAPLRCLMCPDESSEFADISVGDAWLREFKNERAGESIVIARTNIGRKLMNLASSSSVLSLKPIKSSRIKEAQAEHLEFKKRDLKTRLAMMKTSRQKIPEFKIKSYCLNNSRFSFVRNFFILFNVRASENRLLVKLLTYFPFSIFRLYYGFYKFLCLL